MSNKKTLQVGDVVYKMFSNTLYSRHEVERVTKTMAFIENGTTKLSIEYTPGEIINEIGRHTYSTVRYHIETPQLKARWERKELVFDLETQMKTKLSKLTNDQIRLMLNILNDAGNVK